MAYTKLTPDMTSNTAPSGTVSVDAYAGANEPWILFNEEVSDFVYVGSFSGTKAASHWVQYEFPAAEAVVAYRFYTPNTSIYPKDWTAQGWNGSGWDTLHSVSGFTKAAAGWSETFVLSAPGSYARYRLLFTDWTGSFTDVVYLNEIELLGVTVDFEVPSLSFGFSPEAPTHILGAFAVVPSVTLSFTPQEPSLSIGPVSLTMPAVAMAFTPQPPTLTIVPDAAIPSTIIYRCTLTGAQNVVLPISSYQARYRTGSPSYLSVVVPDGATYANAITANAAGQIVLERGVKFFDGTQQLVEIMRVNLEDIRDDQGGSNRSITLTGHRTTTNTVPKSITVQNVTYVFSGTGSRRVRADMDLNLRPGDTAVYPGGSLVVGVLSYTVGANAGETMEITEAE